MPVTTMRLPSGSSTKAEPQQASSSRILPIHPRTNQAGGEVVEVVDPDDEARAPGSFGLGPHLHARGVTEVPLEEQGGRLLVGAEGLEPPTPSL